MALFLCNILFVCLLMLTGASCQDELTVQVDSTVKPDRSIVVDEKVWHYFNWASFDQDKIVSFGNFQYTIYWDADKVLVVVRRDLSNNKVETLRLPAYTLTIDPKDGHRNTVLGISSADGRLHLSWDHHNNDLHYTKSRKDFLTNPPDEMSPEDFEPAQPLAPDAPQNVTYPRFINDSMGHLYLIYRSGVSGNGRSVFARYNEQIGTWHVSSGYLFGSEGTYQPWQNSSSRNAYLNDVLFDQNDRLHITWVYREWGGTWASNHDLHYCYSDDFGITWMNNDGLQIANLSMNDAIEIDDPGIVVQEIPVYSWLINSSAMNLDSKNQPHVVLFHLPDIQKPEKLEHNPPEDVKANLCYYHYWKDVDGNWHNSGPLYMVRGSNGSTRRPDIIIDKNDNVIFYWSAADRGFYCYVLNAFNNWKTASLVKLTDSEFTASTTKHDRRLFKNKEILSFTVDPKGDSSDRGFSIIDFDMVKILNAAQ